MRLNRKPKRKTAGYSRDDVFYLKWGHDYTRDGIAGDEEATRQAWEVFRSELLRDWMHEDCHNGRGGPGTRPWAWWKYDAPELRRRLNGVHPFESAEREAVIAEREQQYPDYRQRAMKTYFGLPSCLMIPDDFQADYESEREFLTRLNLLMECER